MSQAAVIQRRVERYIEELGERKSYTESEVTQIEDICRQEAASWRSHYLLGRMYQCKRLSVEALQCYLAAASLLDNSEEGKTEWGQKNLAILKSKIMRIESKLKTLNPIQQSFVT